MAKIDSFFLLAQINLLLAYSKLLNPLEFLLKSLEVLLYPSIGPLDSLRSFPLLSVI